MRKLQGLGVSPGINIGTIVRVSSRGERIFRLRIEPGQVEQDVERFMTALEKAREQLSRIKTRIEQALGHAHAYILDAHLLMLEDQQLVEEIKSIIRTRYINAEWAIKMAADRMLTVYAQINDDYLRERGSDIEDVVNRLITILSGNRPSRWLPQGAILVTEQILPSIVAEFNLDAVVGLAAQAGGRTSHAAIIARSLGIPAVVGLDIGVDVEAGVPAVIDGNSGVLIVDPTDDVLAQYQQRRTENERLWSLVRDRTQLPAETRDGVKITLRANIELPSEAETLSQYGAQGIGLFRTQYLFLPAASEPPLEEVQFNAYRQLAEACGPDGVAIRTFDWVETRVRARDYEPEVNPALGLRAIRFSLQAEHIFRAQLRAILRAAYYGQVRVVLPLISTITELRQSRRLLHAVAEELRAEGVPHNEDIPIGVMIEVPAAVMIADVLAREADFFSLGTNDLTQYLLAVDRDNNRVAYLYKALHPALLRALKKTVEAAATASIPVEVCGEMASDPLHALVLIGLGLRSLSMAPKAIPFIKDIIRLVDSQILQKTVARALELESAEQVEELLYQQWKDVVPALFQSRDAEVRPTEG
ncbi:MAG: phosphoenolpyruvate--protein phosphotransferase [Acidobacteria bacterium]|nr:phosphoenolpyruvate--protein phosphotransferase [Acidobacteriota bacterium]